MMLEFCRYPNEATAHSMQHKPAEVKSESFKSGKGLFGELFCFKCHIDARNHGRGIILKLDHLPVCEK